MFSKSRDRLRHQRLMDVADDLVLHAPLPEAVTPAQIAASAFGRYRLEISEAEALKYLAAVLIGRNHPFDHLSHPTD
jgi:hypothetical protein